MIKMGESVSLFRLKLLILIYIIHLDKCYSNEILGCGGFVKSHVNLDVSNIEIGLYTKEDSLLEKTECAPTNGYYFLPLYEKGEYILKVHPPAGWSFEPSQVYLNVDGETDKCSTGQDINFSFNGFGITGRVITLGQKQGPSGIAVQLVNDKGEVRNTVTSISGDFHFTPVIPGKYVLKASHSKWKLEPSQANVQVKEGNTVLPEGVLVVKGYDVTGSIISFGNPISGVYVLLYSKEDNPKFRVEGCKTALLQGVPDSPICYSVSDSSGEFSFGLVPAGEYKLLAMTKSPGQATMTYNIKPDVVPFIVQHDSLYIKNAFEVTGFNIMGTVLESKGGSSMAGVQVALSGQAVATTDSAGKFTINALKPGVYNVAFRHERCEWDEFELSLSPSGLVVGAGAAGLQVEVSRWRVCGAVSPPAPRRVTLVADSNKHPFHVTAATDGKWCLYLPPGPYSAYVEVTDQEKRDGLQYYPERQRVTVGGSTGEVRFSQLRARVSGRVVIPQHLREYAADVAVRLRPLAPDGEYASDAGALAVTPDAEGNYQFKDVPPGSFEVSVSGERLCWSESAHNIGVATETHATPELRAVGLRLRVWSSHATQLEYRSAAGGGRWAAPAGDSVQCAPRAATYTLTPRGCHRMRPDHLTVAFSPNEVASARFKAVAHAATVRVLSPEPGADISLQLTSDAGSHTLRLATPTRGDTGYVYEHTLYLAEGEAVAVSAWSPQLVVRPAAGRVLGAAHCQPEALTLRAARGVLLAGRVTPPVAGVTVTLTSDELTLSQETGPDGTYRFGPLEQGRQYRVRAEKTSYEFSEPDDNGDIVASKLAEILVELQDERAAPLEGALVSVSGGLYRRNVASGPAGRLQFAALSPAQYYVKANMKEYRFTPPHHIVDILDGTTHNLTFRGTRVAWSAWGHAWQVGGAPVGGLPLRARSLSPRCAAQDATSTTDGYFKIRGLVPECQYVLELRDTAGTDLARAYLVKGPDVVQVRGADVESVRLVVMQPARLTDVTVRVRAHADHYRALRLALAAEHAAQPQYVARAAPALHTLPRLPADNGTYHLRLEASLSRATHDYQEPVLTFQADGRAHHFDIYFEAQVKSSDQELRASSLVVLALVTLLGVGLRMGYARRDRLMAALAPARQRQPKKKTH
ncbi:nodal modulator 1 [Leptidea sinapis]|uniref:nodal modulator 1 n=1 Tax=Leptidea sinapis TaxID=189913 RepID=UPI0021C35AAB|nr:nodal modulator 1 [Leptidea sinapis]